MYMRPTRCFRSNKEVQNLMLILMRELDGARVSQLMNGNVIEFLARVSIKATGDCISELLQCRCQSPAK